MNQPFKVSQNYRKNKLSFKAGGYNVILVHENGQTLEYDNIKYPEAYCTASFNRDDKIVKAYVRDPNTKKVFLEIPRDKTN